MQLTVKYFGLIAELTGCEIETIECSNSSVAELCEMLYIKYPELKLKDFQVAQDKAIVAKSDMVTGAEIALLPPFSGG